MRHRRARVILPGGGGRGCIPDTTRCARHRGARVILPGVEGEDVFRILPSVRDTGEPGLFYLEWRARIYSGYSPVCETPGGLFYLEWKARMYSGYSPVCETPGSQGYLNFTWSGGRGCIPDTPRCARHWRARVILPGVEGEDVFRILPGVRDTSEPGLFYLEWRARMYSGYSPVCETPASQGYFTWSGGQRYIPDTLGVRDTGEPGLFYLEWRARMYSGYSPVCETRGASVI